MNIQIEIDGNAIHTADDLVGGKVSITVIDSDDIDPDADLVELHSEDSSGATCTVRLSRCTAQVLALLLGKVVDSDLGFRPASVEELDPRNGHSLSRDALLKALLPLPREAEIDVQIGADYLAITGLGPGRGPESDWFALQCNPNDLTSFRTISPEGE
ncbi:hypothetical protein [Actinoplanes sp. NPDC051494]|uniref:hypothetical protein n=1 Tax=Actinoplanes sp. NPDC051494 TaxID=3363907 RepID=UPI0037971176